MNDVKSTSSAGILNIVDHSDAVKNQSFFRGSSTRNVSMKQTEAALLIQRRFRKYLYESLYAHRKDSRLFLAFRRAHRQKILLAEIRKSRSRSQWALLKTSVFSTQIFNSMHEKYAAQSQQELQKLAMMEHDGKLVTTTTAGTERHITEMGDVRYYTAEILVQRHVLTVDAEIHGVTNSFFDLAAHHLSDGNLVHPGQSNGHLAHTLTKTDYMALMLRLSRVLIPDFDRTKTITTINEDWKRDSKGQEMMFVEDMHKSLFELADMWVDGVDAQAYADFLHSLLCAIAVWEPGNKGKKGRWRYRDMDDVEYGIDASGKLKSFGAARRGNHHMQWHTETTNRRGRKKRLRKKRKTKRDKSGSTAQSSSLSGVESQNKMREQMHSKHEHAWNRPSDIDNVSGRRATVNKEHTDTVSSETPTHGRDVEGNRHTDESGRKDHATNRPGFHELQARNFCFNVNRHSKGAESIRPVIDAMTGTFSKRRNFHFDIKANIRNTRPISAENENLHSDTSATAISPKNFLFDIHSSRRWRRQGTTGNQKNKSTLPRIDAALSSLAPSAYSGSMPGSVLRQKLPLTRPEKQSKPTSPSSAQHTLEPRNFNFFVKSESLTTPSPRKKRPLGGGKLEQLRHQYLPQHRRQDELKVGLLYSPIEQTRPTTSSPPKSYTRVVMGNGVGSRVKKVTADATRGQRRILEFRRDLTRRKRSSRSPNRSNASQSPPNGSNEQKTQQRHVTKLRPSDFEDPLSMSHTRTYASSSFADSAKQTEALFSAIEFLQQDEYQVAADVGQELLAQAFGDSLFRGQKQRGEDMQIRMTTGETDNFIPLPII